MPLKLENLVKVMPESVLKILPDALIKYEVNTSLRASHFLGQIAHESGDFTIKTESLYYTHAKQIALVWPTRFNLTGGNDKKNANDYICDEKKLAQAVYDGRMGNDQPGDGFRFRGGGFLQLTGKEAYIGYAKYIDKSVGETADLLRTDNFYALDAALWEYCKIMKLNLVADQGSTDDIIKKITKKINGGYTGLDDRIHEFKKYFGLLS